MTRRILIDCDGVMASFTPSYLNILHDVTGRAHSINEVTTFWFSECICTPEEDAKVWEIIKKTPGFVRNLPAFDGVLEGLEILRSMGEVVCVTSPVWGSSWADERFHWLLDYGFDKRSVVFASDKSHVHGDVLIDDHGKNLDEWSAEHPGIGLLMAQPWNRHVRHHVSVFGLVDAANYLRAVMGY